MNAALKSLALNKHGFATFDYDQANHPDYPALVANHGVAARPGLCGALTILWLDGYKNHRGLRAFRPYAETDATGRTSVTTYTNEIATAGAGWQARVNGIMTGLGFGAAGSTAVGAGQLDDVLATTQYGILVAYSAAQSHGMGVRTAGRSILFFDPNEGEVHFPNRADFGTWVYGPIGFSARILARAYGSSYRLMMMKYT